MTPLPTIQIYEVYVYTHEREPWRYLGQRPPLVLAYTRHQGPSACLHAVPATSGEQAKRQAIKDHRAGCLPTKKP